MLLSETIEVRVAEANMKHFKSLGYDFQKKGDIITISVCDLLPTSRIKVLLRCDDCGVEFEREWYNYKNRKADCDLCRKCCTKGKYNSQYGKQRRELLVYVRSFAKQNPMKGKKHSVEARLKMSQRKVEAIANGTYEVKSNNRGHKLKYYSTKNNETFYADSALEHLRMTQLDADDSVIRWTKRHGLKIEYIYDGTTKNYVPDFLIEKVDGNFVVEEVKGYEKEIDHVKKEFAERYCELNGYTYVFTTQKEMNKDGAYRAYLKKLKEKGVIK